MCVGRPQRAGPACPLRGRFSDETPDSLFEERRRAGCRALGTLLFDDALELVGSLDRALADVRWRLSGRLRFGSKDDRKRWAEIGRFDRFRLISVRDGSSSNPATNVQHTAGLTAMRSMESSELHSRLPGSRRSAERVE